MRITWAELGTGAAATLDGRQVEIEGWVCPFAPGAAHGYFALVPEAPCCVGCLPAEPDRRIEVFSRAPVAAGRSVRLRGEWRVLDQRQSGWRWQLRDADALAAPGPAFTRRGLLGAGGLVCLASAAPGAHAANSGEAARQAIADAATVDVHSHAGGIANVNRVQGLAEFAVVAGRMREGGMAAACLAVVSDGPVHRVMGDGRIHPFREPAPGELYTYGQLALKRLHDLIREQALEVIVDAAGLAAARSARPSVIVAAEGGDFLEGRADRVDEAYERWQLRHLQLTHYRVNELGDIQTEAPVHGGLTEAGAEVIRRCNRRGLVVDVAHGTYDLVKRAAEVTTKPLVLSHTSLSRAPRARSRLISAEHALVVAGTGGIIGIWPPQSIFHDLAAMAGGIARMVDVVGVDHVALGSDMRGLVGPSVFDSYRDLPALAAALLDHGFGVEDVRKVLGGNYLRVFAASTG